MDAERLFEERHFAETLETVRGQLRVLEAAADKKQEDIAAAAAEMREETSHAVSGSWDSDSFEQLVELSQFAAAVSSEMDSYETIVQRIRQREMQLDSPYFARIDFKFDTDGDNSKIYIGRFSLMHAHKLEICDWRSPVASMFYRYGPGRAAYTAPNGEITGEIGLKRQYEIKSGVLEYFFDADVEILDAFLRKLLSQNASPRMKSIVETIQRDQDIAIRDMESDLMMVQGVAGSGKTSIALHRAAYLMYQGLSAKLSANNIIILSPNALFERYISNVLPDLGEKNVVSATFEDVLAALLKGRRIQTKNQFLEILITSDGYRQVMKDSLAFKASRRFGVILSRLLADAPRRCAEAGAARMYAGLFEDKDYFYGLAEGVELPGRMEDIWDFTRENLSSGLLYYDDAVALSFLELKMNGTSAYKNIKQVVIDEAQDYYPLHYEIFSLLFPKAKYTVLGDVSQTLEKREDLSLYEQISACLNKRKTALVRMDKSFRCTSEILDFSSKFAPQGMAIQSFNRQGPRPEIHLAGDRSSLCEKIISETETCLAQGCKSVGLICKTRKNARALFDGLRDSLHIRIITDEDATDLQGVFIIPVYLSKGLEFDAVLLCDADRANYHSEEDRQFLYVACTRALHRLSLFCEGDASPLL